MHRAAPTSRIVPVLLDASFRKATRLFLTPHVCYQLFLLLPRSAGGSQVPYFLDEAADWAMTTANLEMAAEKARAEGVNPRALCIINPGNPTGQVMTEENIAEVIDWAAANGVLLMADEVYQTNVYDPDMEFHSFKKVLRAGPHADTVELVSFHSTSKGVIGECGMRGGYLELCNIHPETADDVYKSLSVNLCSNLPGQVMTDLMVNPPKEGDPSYALYKEEFDGIFTSLTRRAKKLVAGLNDLEGVTCNASSGAMYAFPSITMPDKFVEDCAKSGVPADTKYCLELLDATGICVVPGSGFGQVDGTWHFRTTFLPQEDAMDSVNDRLATFHNEFLSKWK
jgi:alanine transaminase